MEKKVSMELALKIERELLERLDAVKREKKLTDEEWGKRAFAGETINARRKIQNLKNPQANGKPQQLNVSDYVRLCAPLELDAGRILSIVLDDNGL